jgi:hypothetical protein
MILKHARASQQGRLQLQQVLDKGGEARIDGLATAYIDLRKSMWNVLADKVGEDWAALEFIVHRLFPPLNRCIHLLYTVHEEKHRKCTRILVEPILIAALERDLKSHHSHIQPRADASRN